MDKFKNVARNPMEVIGETSLGDAGTITGGTPNVMPGYSIADESKNHIAQGPATDSDLDMDMYAHMPIKTLTL